MAEEWSSLHARYSEQVSLLSTPAQTSFSSQTPPRGRTASASQPHLHTLHPPPASRRTPSDLLTSSGGSCSQEDVGYATHRNLNYSTQSQSHPNIHSLGFSSKSSAPNQAEEADPKSGLTSSSDSHAETATPPTEVVEPQSSPRSYVNFDVDELNDAKSREQRLKRLSPLELSIEKELEKMTPSSEERPLEDDAELHPYANWQFEKMNEKAQKAPATTTHTKPLLNGVPMGRQEKKSTGRGAVASPLRKPLKPPSPFRLQNLSDLTSVDGSSSTTASSTARETSLPQKMPKVTTTSDAAAEEESSRERSGRSPGKTHGFPKSLDDVTAGRRNLDQILPSQLNLGGKPRSYTSTSQFLAKKKPILPPGGSGGGGGGGESGGGGGGGGDSGKRGSLKSRLGKRHKKEGTSHQETLEELEHSYEKESTAHPASSSRGMFLSLGREAGREAATKSEKPGSPSNELLRKLTLRRQRLEQQLMTSGKHTSGSTTASSTGGGDSSSRTSTSSTQSELVCSYNVKRSQDDLSCGPSSLADVELRSKEEGSLAKYGIMEEGKTYEI